MLGTPATSIEATSRMTGKASVSNRGIRETRGPNTRRALELRVAATDAGTRVFITLRTEPVEAVASQREGRPAFGAEVSVARSIH